MILFSCPSNTGIGSLPWHSDKANQLVNQGSWDGCQASQPLKWDLIYWELVSVWTQLLSGIHNQPTILQWLKLVEISVLNHKSHSFCSLYCFLKITTNVKYTGQGFVDVFFLQYISVCHIFPFNVRFWKNNHMQSNYKWIHASTPILVARYKSFDPVAHALKRENDILSHYN